MSPESPSKVFGRRLRFLRTMAGMTQARLAEDSGISVDHLSKIERGLGNPSFAVIQSLSAAMGVRPAGLFDNSSRAQDREAPDGTRTYLRELNHRIKNSYGILAALADLACMDSQSEETKTACRDLSAKIRHMAMLHDMLSGRTMDDTMDLGDYLHRIFGQLTDLHPHRKLTLHIRADEVLLPARKALPFGLAAFELLTNAYKHADSADTVSVMVNDAGGDKVTVKVSDNGSGLPKPAGGCNGGRGLALVRTLVEDQLGGSFSLSDNDGVQAVFSFRVTD